MNWKGYGRKREWANLGFKPSICLERLTEITKYLSQVSIKKNPSTQMDRTNKAIPILCTTYVSLPSTMYMPNDEIYKREHFQCRWLKNSRQWMTAYAKWHGQKTREIPVFSRNALFHQVSYIIICFSQHSYRPLLYIYIVQNNALNSFISRSY